MKKNDVFLKTKSSISERVDKMKSLEILSPAGSFEALKAAIDSGADAVYFGGKALSARKNAVNLSNEEIIEAVRYAHLRSAKLYAAVNTLVFDTELKQAFDFIKFCYTSGVDGIIVQDLGIAHMVKKYFPDLRMHASTQMTIHNLQGAREAQKLGFSRVVLSRELSLKEISYIAQNCDIELEVFVHGALCMSYSGQCLFSSFLGGRSGNRGACAQPCRLNYTLLDENGNMLSEKDKYLLSLKDLCLVEYISELKNAGVTSLKIEGRMKGEAYVSAVTGIYNKYRSGTKVSEDDKNLLQNIFSRDGFTQGHFKNAHGREMLSYEKNHDNIFASATDDVIDKARAFANNLRKIYIDAKFIMKKGEPAYFEAVYNGKTFSALGDTVAEPASSMPVDKDRIDKQLRKLGSTNFEYNSLYIDAGDGLYVPVKEINNIRRKLIEEIEAYIVSSGRQYNREDFLLPKFSNKEAATQAYTASVLTRAQADACYDLGFSKIYIPYSLYKQDKSRYDMEPDVYCVKLPPVNHDSKNNDFSFINVNSVCITNIGQIGMVSPDLTKYADYRLNVYNSLSFKKLSQLGFDAVCLSPELTLSQMKNLCRINKSEVLVYGRVALMTVKNCLVKSSLNKCGCKDGEIYYLRDRKNICFPTRCIKGECVNIIYNSAPIYMADRMNEVSKIKPHLLRFDFTTETPQEISRILNDYEKGKKSNNFFTRGHFYNGVN